MPKDFLRYLGTLSMFLCVCFSTECTQNAEKIDSQLSQEGNFLDYPISTFVRHRSGYSTSFDARHRNPEWVYEHLSAEKLIGEVERTSFAFKEDKTIPSHLRSTLSDYRGSGFDRGHMAPAGNNRSSSEAMGDTFFLTNICPQSAEFNRGYWNKLEKHVRDLTKDYLNVYVVSGPLYLPTIEENGKRYVKYQVIGENDIAVPTHFFKVITCEENRLFDVNGTPVGHSILLLSPKMKNERTFLVFFEAIKKAISKLQVSNRK